MYYAFLRAEGIRHLERLASQQWTDFNAHDPGITILEQFCYAFTDLANRIDYPLPDLLMEGGEDAYASLYRPAQILTSQPVTLNDLRKLIIDVEGVKNAWVEKVEAQQTPLYYNSSEKSLSLQGDTLGTELVLLKGLYRVRIELSDLFYSDATESPREVKTRSHSAAACASQPWGRLGSGPGTGAAIYRRRRADRDRTVDDAESVLLNIYQTLANHVSPSIPFYTLDQLLAAGKPVDKIYEGPLLEHGFIDTDDLTQALRRTTIHTSDMIHKIMAVPGVRAVRTISISDGGAPQAWSLNLDPNKAPKLNIQASDLRLERNGLTTSIAVEKVRRLYYQSLRYSPAFHQRMQDQRSLQPPAGRRRNVGRYYSLQHQFPATYGIGATGLPASASPQRQAQAKQLKAYLLFFDQLLANYFAQLAHVGALFAFSGDTAQTYFAQPIDDPTLGLADILPSDRAAHQSRLQQITENPYMPGGEDASQTDLRRRNRFLNHLLARFAEQFTDYSLVLYGAMSAEGVAPAERLVQDKQAFLQEYPQLSSARGTAFNYLLPAGGDNRSGLEKRLRRKLGIESADEDFYLVEHILLRPTEGDAGQEVPILAAPQRKDPYSLQISFVFPHWPARYQDASFKTFVERTVREETPAHLAPRILWLDQVALATFTAAYQEWLATRRSWLDRNLGGISDDHHRYSTARRPRPAD